jgi:aspartokinase/homoserine dehydrogenase 1
MKVLKFGGTSVGSAASIQTLLNILKDEVKNEDKPVVVLSAMGGVTNLLASMAEDAANGKEFTAQLAELERRHFEVVKTLLDVQNQNPAFTRLKIHFNQLEELLQGVLTLRELTPKTRDQVLSFGERCSTIMVSKIAAQHFKDVLYVDAADVIKTDSAFGNAKVNTELTELLIRTLQQENKDKILFVTGFIAGNDAGQTTTLGRGGSDYTAAIFGAALNAKEVQIWTDVNGMMTADPDGEKSILINRAYLYRSDGTILLWRQGNLSANHDPGFFEKDPYRDQKYF